MRSFVPVIRTLITVFLALLLGAAFQFRLDPASTPTSLVLAGLHRLLDLAPAVVDG